MRRGHLIGLALLLTVGGAAGAYLYTRPKGPHAGRLPRSGGERPWTKVVEGPGHDQHLNGVDRIACRDCHIIRAEKFLKPDNERCRSCHERLEPTLHASAEAQRPDVCTGCHSFLRTAGVDPAPWNCQRCHARAQGDVAAIAVHANERCATCHRPHQTPATAPAECNSCHEHSKIQARHGDRRGADLCLDCHEPHGEASVATARCAGCHVRQEAPVDPTLVSTTASGTAPGPAAPQVPAAAIWSRGHEACTDCHANHDFEPSAAKSCRSCHADRRVLGEDRARAHSNCTSCHDNHDARRSAVGSCGRCHGALRPQHPETEGGRCLGCHDIHPRKGAGNVRAQACSSCHEAASNETAFHAGGTRCVQCHRPHQFAAPGPGGCRACHAEQANLTASNQGHQQCTRCHQAHRPTEAPAACPTCHAVEARTAPAGHRDCQRCHEQHSGARRTTCTGCHQDRTQMLHGDLPGGCASCHRPHGPGGRAAVPACTSCHNAAALPNLHQEQGHQQCRACHGGHSGPRANRETCVACHEDRETHEPEARRCSGCHAFGEAQ